MNLVGIDVANKLATPAEVDIKLLVNFLITPVSYRLLIETAHRSEAYVDQLLSQLIGKRGNGRTANAGVSRTIELRKAAQAARRPMCC